VWLVLSTIPAFALTGLLTREYRGHERSLATQWFARAEAERRQHATEAAVLAYQNAVRFSPGNADYRFALGRALVEAQRPVEAQARLLSLWEAEPGNGPVNLELGRLAAASGNKRDAVRYYHNAVEGSWEDAPERHRREARLELARFLLDHGDRAGAQAELLPLVNDLPAEPSGILRIGTLLFEAGAVSRARAVFETGVQRAPREPSLLEASGHAAFAEQEYGAARSYLDRARRAGATGERLDEELALSNEVPGLDPLQRRLPRSERARRASRAFAVASARLATCLNSGLATRPDLASLKEERAAVARRATVRAMQKDPDLLDAVMDVVFRIEHTTQTGCGQPGLGDTALLLVERLHSGSR
jgi:predicted Zn-dependent protease